MRRREARAIALVVGLMGCSLTWNPPRQDAGSPDASDVTSSDASDISSPDASDVVAQDIDFVDASDVVTDAVTDGGLDRGADEVVDAPMSEVHEDVLLDRAMDAGDSTPDVYEDVLRDLGMDVRDTQPNAPEVGMDTEVSMSPDVVDTGTPSDDGVVRDSSGSDLGPSLDVVPASDADASVPDAGDGACPTIIGDAGVTCDGGDCRHRVRKVATGTDHSCALMEDGHVFCWGSNSDGQLGQGARDMNPHPRPVLVPCVTNAVDIGAGPLDTCAVLADGGVMCWGQNFCGGPGDEEPDSGVLSRGYCASMTTYPVILTPRRVRLVGVGGALLHVVNITIAENHRCVRTRDREVYCWGLNTQGNTGTGTSERMLSRPGQVLTGRVGSDTTPLRGVEHVSAYGTHTCALVASGDGGTSEVRCWGPNEVGRAGIGDAGPELSVAAYPVVGLRAPTSVSGGQAHSCALTDAGAAGGVPFCWGSNYFGELGTRTLSYCPTPSPVPVALDGGAALIAAGHEWTCAAVGTSTENALWCWGANGNRALFGSAVDRCPVGGLPGCGADAGPGVLGVACNFAPVRIPGVQNVRQIAFNVFSLCVTTVAGDAFCWGGNSLGQLGDGTTTSRAAPVQVVFR